MADYVVVNREQLEADLTTVADSIRGLIETEEKLEFPQGMKEAVESYTLDDEMETQDALIEQIKDALQGKSGINAKNQAIYEYGTGMSYMFYNAVFPEDYTLEIDVQNISELANVQYAFGYTNVKKIVLSGNKNKAILNYSYFCSNSKEMEEFDFTNWNFIIKECAYMFGTCTNLVRLIGEFDFSQCTKIINPFNSTTRLEEVRIKKETLSLSISFLNSGKLSDTSIQSIIDGLATVEEQQTLTLHKDVKAKLTEDQITTITYKNWTLA